MDSGIWLRGRNIFNFINYVPGPFQDPLIIIFPDRAELIHFHFAYCRFATFRAAGEDRLLGIVRDTHHKVSGAFVECQISHASVEQHPHLQLNLHRVGNRETVISSPASELPQTAISLPLCRIILSSNTGGSFISANRFDTKVSENKK